MCVVNFGLQQIQENTVFCTTVPCTTVLLNVVYCTNVTVRWVTVLQETYGYVKINVMRNFWSVLLKWLFNFVRKIYCIIIHTCESYFFKWIILNLLNCWIFGKCEISDNYQIYKVASIIKFEISRIDVNLFYSRLHQD